MAKNKRAKQSGAVSSLDPSELRALLGDVQQRLAAMAEDGAGVVRILNLGETPVYVGGVKLDREVPAGQYVDIEPELVQGETGEEGLTRLWPRSVVSVRLRAKEGGRVSVDPTGLAAGRAHFGEAEILLRAQDGWVVEANPTSLVDVAPGQHVDVLVIGRGPRLDVGSLMRKLFIASNVEG